MIDVIFPLMGKQLPVDHGYYLFSAISSVLPDLHNDTTFGIHPVNGQIVGNRILNLTEFSRLVIRTPVEHIRRILPLAGKTLNVGNHLIYLGIPNTNAITPSSQVYSRLVVIKGFMEPETFLAATCRQLSDLNIQGDASLVEQHHIAAINNGRFSGTHSPYLRRTINIHGKEIVGFALRVGNLTDEDSLRLQEHGIGGRRKFGCGIFVPVRNINGRT
ncbi:CRISPR-associated endonuclease Cas6 [Sporotomaculum syntrophicum]|uniref:CRISPR-associated endonuclease Cas6 n=1 Tax=Sporotomaculum syntrophicum TaxID=182264 RepID=A0A9D2WMC7_9FIRM|nr:type I-MYXAN CRISPR-associated protein Cas6/Cmx6 [Sporotomaculum syntrophicum]KAF1083919.1 CRISPR-associated endonuclease Cas6 [Sporotomaculum syntrophicum]